MVSSGDGTDKGLATAPKKSSGKDHTAKKTVDVDIGERETLWHMPDPATETGSLGELFKGKNSKELIEEARLKEAVQETRLIIMMTGGRKNSEHRT